MYLTSYSLKLSSLRFLQVHCEVGRCLLGCESKGTPVSRARKSVGPSHPCSTSLVCMHVKLEGKTYPPNLDAAVRYSPCCTLPPPRATLCGAPHAPIPSYLQKHYCKRC